MAREKIRQLKRTVLAGRQPGAAPEERTLSGDAALALLERSIKFGHGRLAVLRLSIAVDSDARIPPDYWRYCSRAAELSGDASLKALYLQAARRNMAIPEARELQ